jgi:UDP-N-acetylmuramoylalanine--D-glutamate ligase
MQNRRNLVLGLGKTGVSVVRWLAARGEAIVVNDSRGAPPGADEISPFGSSVVRRFGAFDHQLLDVVDQVVVSPGVSRQEPIVIEALDRGLPVIGDIELFALSHVAPMVAVTGTNGKSTVTTLVAEMVTASGKVAYAGGNLGVPALDLLSQDQPDFYILELSSYQLESTTSLHPTAAVVLNVTPDHMDRYGDLSAYADAKSRIYANARVGILNADDPTVRKMKVPNGERRQFGLVSDHCDYAVHDGWIVCRGESLMRVAEVRMPGAHNISNALAAIAICDSIGIPHDAMCNVLRQFGGLPHRMQVVSEFHGVRYVDDSKGTNVGATVAAVEGLAEPIVLVAGGDGKGQDFSPLAHVLSGRVRHAVLIGRDRQILADAIAGACSIEFASDMNEAVAAAARAARPGNIVLLSPACASLDMYRDYSERGDHFAEAARRLSA